MGLEADRHNKRKWFCKVAWPSWHGLDQAQNTLYVDKARAKHMEKVQAMDDLPAQELNPPEIPEPPQPVSTPKIRQAWKAKAFDEMTRSTEKALREGTPAEKKVALQVANAAAGAIASVGGPHTRKVAQSDFQREDLQGHGQQRWQQQKSY